MSRPFSILVLVLCIVAAVAAGPLAAQSTINAYSLGADIQPVEIAPGPDGNLWYAVYGDGSAGSSKVGRITPTGTITEFVLADTSRPIGIVTGPDGKVWFTESGAMPVPNPPGAASIGRIDPATFPAAGSITHFSAGVTFGSYPFGICVGPDGNLWFTERNHSAVARITTAGAVTEFPISSPGATPLGIAAGPDGNLWVSDRGTSSVIVISTAGTVLKRIATPTPSGNPSGICAGPDGRMWFVEIDGNKVGVLATTATVPGDITEYATPTPIPYRIVSGPDGNLWFSENGGGPAGRVARITTLGAITEYTAPGLSGPYGMCVGPDRAVWFTERDAVPTKIGQLLVDCVVAVPTITGGGTQCGGTTLTLTANAGWASYQWYRNGTAIPGATSATFTKTATTNDTGNYTVSGANGGCVSNPSAPVSVTISGPTTATAGGPQSICPSGTSAGLGGNTPTVGTGVWSVVSGGTGTFAPNASTPNATFTHTGGTGPILLAWTITSPPCPASVANVTITIACPGASRFFVATPCRRVDTRSGPDTPALAAGEQRSFVLTGAPCSVPAGAKSVSVNLTITGASGAGDLRAFATGTALPSATVINFSAGQTRANNAIVALSGDGRIDVKNDATGSVHVIVDVNGYFQ